jgi:hypothetical protein
MAKYIPLILDANVVREALTEEVYGISESQAAKIAALGDEEINDAITDFLDDDLWDKFHEVRGAAIAKLAKDHPANVKVTTGICGDDQINDFQNATYAGLGSGFGVSLAIDPSSVPGVAEATTEQKVAAAITAYFTDSPLNVEAQVGQDTDD